VDQDGHVGPYYLVDAATDENAITILELLVKHGWDVNQEDGLKKSTLLGRYVESINKPKKVIRWLIAKGADLNAPVADGWMDQRTTIIEAM
jgi:hypothetical protein